MRRASGFTLVEMVVALTILSLLTLATLTALRTLADTQSRLETTVARLDEMRLVSRFLRDSLRQAMPVARPLSFEQYYEGESAAIRWVAPLQGVEGVAGLQYMHLYREGESLVIQFVPYQNIEPAWGSVDANVLLENLQTFEVLYRAGPDEPWVDRWYQGEDEATGLPYAVKLRIQARGRYWPDMVVALDQSQAGL